MHGHRCLTQYALAFAAVLGAAPVRAQSAGVELQLETQTLELGEAITGELICTNTGRPQPPEVKPPDGLELTLVSATPSSNSFTQIVNGQMTQRFTYRFPIQLIGRKEGTYTIGPMAVNTETGTFRTAPVQVTVRKGEEGGKAAGDRYMFVELGVEPRSLYITQTFVATLTFGIRKVELGGRVFDVDMLRDVLDTATSQLSIFANGRAQRSERWLADSSGARHAYEVFKVVKEQRAEQVGATQVGPVFLKAEYPTALRRGFFGGYEVTARRRETARADAVVVEVRGPPPEGRPADYSGAIGRFSMSASAKPTQVEQNQPITLSVAITGTPLEGVAGPNLHQQPELAGRFQFASDELVGDIVGDAKVFRRAVFPRQAGDQTIPPITWSFFDPQTETYVSLGSEPIPISVLPSSRPGLEGAMGADDTAETREGRRLTVVAGGLSPNYVDPALVLASQTFQLSGPWTAALLGPPCVWAAAALLSWRRARMTADPLCARRRRARRNALRQVDRALRDGRPVEQWSGLAQALTGFVADHFGLPAGALTPPEMRDVLDAHGLNGELVTQVCGFLERCDAARYTPMTDGAASPPQLAIQVREWIDRIQRVR